jgi:hypothetical protein
MAVNVDIVYRTVLLIINKEQRGYLTPDEFNKTATQVQLEIFNEYFEDLTQQLRLPGNDSEYSNRVKNLQEKVAIFQTDSVCSPVVGGFNTPNVSDFYKLGTVIYNDDKEVQYVQPNELLELNLSPITKPSKYWPVYTYKNLIIKVYPTPSLTDVISCTYIRKPSNPIWNFTALPPNYQYVYNPSIYDSSTNPGGSQDFELHKTEQTNLITRILLYSGIIIKDPQIIQIAAQQAQAETINSKS